MKSSFKSGTIGFALGLAVAAVGAQAAVQATEHQHPTPSTQQSAASAMRGMEDKHGMKDMDAMMADPAMRQKMMANMAQCRDMMSMMMEHMKHEGKAHRPAAPHRH